ncbi:c17733d6-a600-4b3e-8ba2-0ef96f3acee5 [Thermothielavioides terrestris]|uniref:C17733d6-a600-4b3e-8ba2-0ef96f3acee5 n=1 Tax=Thermothielavioides terrestris TaxID=2587410 RepID=A0A446BGT9_9PEZI|nr:c17733d6-a600-4b3e-8ba2-0ef96f3acee5 [Thermothielavioides terrestris]
MSAPLGNGGGRDPLQNLTPQRRLALAQAARANATREEIEARGIRPDVQQILHHMNRTPSHSFKRARLSDSGVRKIYDDNETDDTSGDDDDDDDELARAEREEREEDEFEEQWQAMLAQEGLQDVNMFVVAEFRQIARQRIRMLKQGTAEWRAAASRPPRKPRFDLVASLCTCTELIVEVCKHMRPVDIVRLYSISRDFKHTINKHMRSSIFAWANYMAPTASRIFSSPIYGRWFIPDPAEQLVTRADVELGQPRRGQANLAEFGPVNDVEGEVRMIPGLLWLQMVVNREIRVRDIIASLARRGHRLPEGARVTLTKLWLIMDAATSEARMTLLKDQDFFSNEDLYIAQLFMVKLVLAFNDPVFGPQSSMLMRLMMGQRGLSPLWAMLRGKKYRTRAEIRQLKLRYDVGPDQVRAFNGMALHGVQVYELGTMHFEGWGAGPDHLMRPDELIPLEAVRRQLDLDSCLEEMMIFGHVDFTTGNSLVPSLDEMYMSDDDLPPAQKDWKPLKHELIHSGCGNVPFEPGMWQPKHARKARWATLSDEEKAMILEAEQEEMDEFKEIDEGAQLRADIAWAKLANLTTKAMNARKLKSKFKLAEPSPDDMQEHLAQFDKPQKLRLASYHRNVDSDDDSDAMDVDQPASAFNELVLEPIPPAELRRLLPRNPDESSDESDYEDEDDEDDYDYNYNYDLPAQGQLPEQQQPQQPEQQQQQQDLQAEDGDDETTSDDDDYDDGDDDDEDVLPNPPIYDFDPVDPSQLLYPTPATTAVLSEGGTDEMLLAQADMVYSDDDDEDDDDGEGDSADDDYEGDGEEADGDVVMGEENRENRAEQMMMAGMGAGFDVDWDRFLSHPAEYAAALQEAALAAARAEALEEAEEVNINTLVDGLHGGQHDDDDADDVQDHQVQQPGHGNGNVEDTIDWEKYIADEDIGEDPRTKMLRDWYRPW